LSRKSGTIAAIIALVVGLVSGFMTWVTLRQITTSNHFFNAADYRLVPDAYNAVYIFATKGASVLASNSSLGAALANASTTTLVAFALILIFWPVMLLSGLLDIARRKIRIYPFIWGVIAFLALILITPSIPGSLGIGPYIDLAAAILFLVAWMLSRSQSARRVPPQTPPAVSPSRPSPSNQPPPDPWSK
jgi:hypothetical protein